MILEDVPQDIGIKTLKVWYACVSVLVYACVCVCVPSICVLESLYLHFLDFAVNGRQKRTKHKGEWGEYKGDQWENRDGDVIGLACDLDKMQMHVSLNGSSAAPTAPPTPLARASLRPFRARQARCASTSARRTSGTRRRPRTSRRMPHLRARPSLSRPLTHM